MYVRNSVPMSCIILRQSTNQLHLQAVSVSLPSWKANIAYEEGENWVLSRMKNGYPRFASVERFGHLFADMIRPLSHHRFFLHESIQAFAADIIQEYGESGEQAFLFPSHGVALRCFNFLRMHGSEVCSNRVRIIDLLTNPMMGTAGSTSQIPLTISAVILPRALSVIAKSFWQHTGDGISSRRAEFCHKAFSDGIILEQNNSRPGLGQTERSCKGPKRYQKAPSVAHTPIHSLLSLKEGQRPPCQVSDGLDHNQFVEERFGRNLDLRFVRNAKLAVKRRIAGSLTANVEVKEALEMAGDSENMRKVNGFSEDDVYLYPTGMSSIYNTYIALLAVRGPLTSICFG